MVQLNVFLEEKLGLVQWSQTHLSQRTAIAQFWTTRAGAVKVVEPVGGGGVGRANF